MMRKFPLPKYGAMLLITYFAFVAWSSAALAASCGAALMGTSALTKVIADAPAHFRTAKTQKALPVCSVPKAVGQFDLSSVAFGSSLLSDPLPSAVSVTFTNTGIRPLTNLNIYTNTDYGFEGFFSTNSTCLNTLAVNASCTFQVLFSPANSPENVTGTLEAYYFSGGSEHSETIPISGARSGSKIDVYEYSNPGITAPLASHADHKTNGFVRKIGNTKGSMVPSTSLDFPPTYQGTQSSYKEIAISNIGNLPQNISGFNILDPSFSVVAGGSCSFPLDLYPNDLCTLRIAFNAPTPAATNYDSVYSGMQILDGTTVLFNVNLSGISAKSPLVPTQRSSYETISGFPPPIFSANFYNASNSTVTISGVSFSTPTNGTAVRVTSPFSSFDCGTTVAPNASCQIRYQLTPPATGSGVIESTMTVNVTGGPTVVDLGAYYNAPEPNLGLSASSYNFGPVPVGGNAMYTVTVTNNEATPVLLSSIQTNGQGYSVSGGTCNTMTPIAGGGGTCTVDVLFSTPNATLMGRIGNLVLVEGKSGNAYSYTVNLNARVVNVAATLTAPSSLSTSAPPGLTSTASVRIRNSGAAGANITGTSISATGTGPAAFSISNDGCTTRTLIAGVLDTCDIDIAYAPSIAPDVNSNRILTVTTSAGDINVTLSGFRSSPNTIVDIAPATLTFGIQEIGKASAYQYFSVANVSTTYTPETENTLGKRVAKVPQNSNKTIPTNLIFGVVLSGATSSSTDFPTADIIHDCPASVTAPLAPGQCCTVGVRFAPANTTPAAKTGVISLQTNAEALFGVGSQLPSNLETLPKRLQYKGSAVASVGVSGTAVAGSTAPVITSPAPTGGTVGVSYSHSMTATGAGMITYAITEGSLPTGLSLSSTGVISGTPTATGMFNFTIDADNTIPPAASQSYSITIAAPVGALPIITGNAPPSGILGQGYNHTFSATSSTPVTWSIVGGSLPPGLSLNSSGAITGVPSAAGSFTFTARATNAAGQANQNSGINIIIPIIPVISLTPSSLDFGNQDIGTVSLSREVRIQNDGNGSFDIRSIEGVGQFAYNAACPATLTPGASCPLNVTFNPISAGALTGIISVNTNALQGNGSLNLRGNGVTVPRANIVVNPSGFDFGDQAVGSVSPVQVVFISNTGTATMQLSGINLVGNDFQQTTPNIEDNPRNHPRCGSSLAPGASCVMGIRFAPVETGRRAGSLSITHDGTVTGRPTTSNYAFTGNATARREAIIRVSGALSFGEQIIGTTSPAQSVTITNVGTINMNVGAINVTPDNPNTGAGDFAVAVAGSGCGTLIPNANCVVSVSFQPIGNAGAKLSRLSIASNATNSIAGVVNLTGMALPIPQPVLRHIPTDIGFGVRTRGSDAVTQQVSVSNTGIRPLDITSITLTGAGSADFSLSHTCNRAIAPNGLPCTIDVTYLAKVLGSSTATVSIVSNAPGSPHTVSVGGASCISSSSPAAQRLFINSCGN